MKPWKLVLGAGAACAACCAAPVVGGLAALAVGSGVTAAVLATAAAYAGWWVPLGTAALALVAVVGALAWRRRHASGPACALGSRA